MKDRKRSRADRSTHTGDCSSHVCDAGERERRFHRIQTGALVSAPRTERRHPRVARSGYSAWDAASSRDSDGFPSDQGSSASLQLRVTCFPLSSPSPWLHLCSCHPEPWEKKGADEELCGRGGGQRGQRARLFGTIYCLQSHAYLLTG